KRVLSEGAAEDNGGGRSVEGSSRPGPVPAAPGPPHQREPCAARDPEAGSVVMPVVPQTTCSHQRREDAEGEAAMRRSLRWTAAVLALVVAGCAEQPTDVTADGKTGNEDEITRAGGPPRLTILLKDAPGDIAEAVVTISKIYLQGDGRVTLMDEPVTTDLLELSNDALTLVDDEEVPAGAYHELRFVITGGYIAVEQNGGGLRYYASSPNYDGLPDGATATGTLHMPSYAQSGLKVKLPEGFEVDGGEVILVDFDVSQS